MARPSELTKRIANKEMEGYSMDEGITNEAEVVRPRRDNEGLLRRVSRQQKSDSWLT